MQPDVDATDHEYAIFGFLDFTDGLAAQAVAIGLDPARLQRASEGSRQSAGHSGGDVVEGRGVRLERCGRDLVVPRHGPVDAERHGLRLGRELRAPQGSFDALDAHPRTVNDVGHVVIPFVLVFSFPIAAESGSSDAHLSCPRASLISRRRAGPDGIAWWATPHGCVVLRRRTWAWRSP